MSTFRRHSLGMGLALIAFGCTAIALIVPAFKGSAAPAAQMQLAAQAIGGAGSSNALGQAKPNIIFILTDDLAVNLVQYMPNLQAMQRDGTTFSNYFVTDSLCCPSRSSIFTGKFPHDTQVLTNQPPLGGYEAFNAHGNESQTFAVALQRGGYKTAMLGKYLNGYEPAKDGVRAGWSQWNVAGNGYPEFNYALNQDARVVQYGHDPKDYLTDVLARIADGFIRGSASGPFFIEIATFAPHAPYIPAPRDADKFPGLTAPRGPAFGVRPGPTAPKWLQEIPPLRPMEITKIDEHFRMRAQSVQAVDKMIGQIRSLLATLGDQNTYVVFSSDNGYHMGEYSLRPGKMTPFDTDINVPLVIVGPGIAKGATVNAIVENVDLASTFTELAGTAPPTAPDGHSLVPLLQGGVVSDWRQAALIEHKRPGPSITDPDAPIPHSADPVTYEALRMDNAMYVEYEDGEVGYYDLTKDPYELTNVAPHMPAAQLQRLHIMLAANKQCHGAQACWTAQHLAP
jgi:N-acetylglucosamine-6-sulfatase